MIDDVVLPSIRGLRVRLRPLTEDDVPSLFRIFSDHEVMRYWSCPPFTDESQAWELYEAGRQGVESGTLFQWGICRRDDDSLIGTCTLWHLDGQNRRAEVGFLLAREEWGQGLMIEALTTLFELAFSALGLVRIEADVDPENAASIGLLERLGFQREGYLRERWIIAGEVFDSVILGLLEREWRSVQQRRASASSGPAGQE